MTGFEINQIRSALIQTGGELQAAMNLIVDGKVEDKDVTNEWGGKRTTTHLGLNLMWIRLQPS